jgi:hypothetical protein
MLTTTPNAAEALDGPGDDHVRSVNGKCPPAGPHLTGLIPGLVDFKL